ncbi:transmembrane amino acid transporter protein-domain-containing protein [Dichotomocladium elegans]|nr:transmembrane amino acid transporter protein-domain-containing protein [Dichotomocladium elegans]
MSTRYQPIESNETASSISSFRATPSIYTSTDNASAYLEDQQPLLSSAATSVSQGDDAVIEFVERPPTASPFSCSINLLNTILGTGLLAMPAALASIGLIPGIVVIILSALASGMGLFFLSRCAARTDGRHASFFAVSKLTWPHMAVVGSFSDYAEDVILMDRRFWITVFMGSAILPLSFLRKLDSLKYTSVIALIAVVYLCAIVVYHFFEPSPARPPPTVEFATFSARFFSRLPVFVFAFTCHQNIFSVYNEIKDNSKRVITNVIKLSIGTACIIYEAIGILGYLTFGKKVLGNIILECNKFVAGGRLAIVVLVVFSYPLQAHPCRASLDKVLAWRSPEARGLKVPPPPSAIKYFIMTTFILVSSYLIAITVSELDLVLAFVGSTGSTTISFILPGIFYYKIHENDPWKAGKISAVGLAVYGVLVMCICLAFNVARLIQS